MTSETTKGTPSPTRWQSATVAFLAGLAVASFMFFLISVVQTPGLDPPPESAALFMVVTTAAVISHGLVRSGDRLGYLAAVLSGGFVFVILGLVATGSYGPVGSRTNPIGPIAYTLLAIAVIVTAAVSWRRDRA